jgi:hypothetical protein
MIRTVAAIALCSAAAGAQSLSDVPTQWDLALGNGTGATSISAGASRATYLGTSDKLRAGFGLRATFVTGTMTLDPKDPRGIGAHDDQLETPTGSLLLNVGVHLGYEVSRKVMVGMNLDFFGLTLGAQQDADLTPEGGGTVEKVRVKPSTPNIFAGGSGDRGSLNSEFFLSWALNDKYAVRGGLSHTLVGVQLTDDQTGTGGSSTKYNKYANMVFLGLRITPPQ